jgi:hypothetical protein
VLAATSRDSIATVSLKGELKQINLMQQHPREKELIKLPL